MRTELPSPLQVLASVTGTVCEDWEDLDGPDSGVGVDYRYRHRGSGAEAYLNLDQDYLTVSVNDERLFAGELGTAARVPASTP